MGPEVASNYLRSFWGEREKLFRSMVLEYWRERRREREERKKKSLCTAKNAMYFSFERGKVRVKLSASNREWSHSAIKTFRIIVRQNRKPSLHLKTAFRGGPFSCARLDPTAKRLNPVWQRARVVLFLYFFAAKGEKLTQIYVEPFLSSGPGQEWTKRIYFGRVSLVPTVQKGQFYQRKRGQLFLR